MKVVPYFQPIPAAGGQTRDSERAPPVTPTTISPTVDNYMQEITLIITIVTPFVLLLIATAILLMNFIKQKKIMLKQQQKLLELIDIIKTDSGPNAGKTYKEYIYEQLKLTQDRFSLLAPRGDIVDTPSTESPVNQRIVALRHAFLRAEELGSTAIQGSEGYWGIFRQTLEPLLQPPQESSDHDELDAYKKRVANLEKFKTLFFALEERWKEAQTKAQQHYDELHTMADEMADRDRYNYLLNQYHDNYNDLNQHIYTTRTTISDQPTEKNINIIRQDPRAAEEILKLRNVAADQYRVINSLQRKLEEAVTAEEKDLLVKELEQQLQRQIRFVQESDTCIQLLEEELTKANEKIAHQEALIDNDRNMEVENQQLKETLHSFTRESKDLLENVEELEQENDQLKNALHLHCSENTQDNNEQHQREIAQLRKQYTELEEKYLELKLK